MGNARTTAKKAKNTTKSRVTGDKDKALMAVIRDCDSHPWCGHSMNISDTHITYQRPNKGIAFDDLFYGRVGVEANCEGVKVEL
jgi:hypothetical protein